MKTMQTQNLHTRKIKEGAGVNLSTLIRASISGKCPCRAPTKHNREDVIMWTDNPPNAAIATAIGITHLKYPNILSPTVCWKKLEAHKK